MHSFWALILLGCLSVRVILSVTYILCFVDVLNGLNDIMILLDDGLLFSSLLFSIDFFYLATKSIKNELLMHIIYTTT